MSAGEAEFLARWLCGIKSPMKSSSKSGQVATKLAAPKPRCGLSILFGWEPNIAPKTAQCWAGAEILLGFCGRARWRFRESCRGRFLERKKFVFSEGVGLQMSYP